MRNRNAAYLELSSAMILVGSSVVVGKMIVSTFPVFLASSLRFGLASVIFIPVLAGVAKGVPSIGKRDWLVIFLQAFTGVFLFSILLLYGLKLTSAAEAGIVTSTTPAVIAVISIAFLGEKVSRRLTVGILLTVLGIIAINTLSEASRQGSAGISVLGTLLILGAVIGEALFTVLRKASSNQVTPTLAAALVSLVGFMMFVPFSIIEVKVSGFSLGAVSLQQWLPIIYYAVVVTVIAFILWFRGVSKVPASRAAVFTGLLPISAVVLSYVILGEAFHWSHLIGGTMVIGGIVVISRESASSAHTADTNQPGNGQESQPISQIQRN